MFHLAFALAFALPRITRVKCKRKPKCKPKETIYFPFLALALKLAFVFALA